MLKRGERCLNGPRPLCGKFMRKLGSRVSRFHGLMRRPSGLRALKNMSNSCDAFFNTQSRPDICPNPGKSQITSYH